MKTRVLFALFVLLAATAAHAAKPIVIGSKKFTESYVLGGIAKTVLEHAGFAVEERSGMGGTIILWQALSSGQIDVYPEYTGTIGEEILKTTQSLSEDEMRRALAKFGIGMSADLGFNNTYALVMRRAEAARLGIRTISDLRRHPELKVGLTHEFLDRQDGWRPLAAAYGLTMPNVSGIDHAIGYAALANGSIDVKDAYSTDAKIQENDLVVLRDDLHFFPEYKAVFLYRLELDPRAIDALNHFGRIDEEKMTSLNAAAERSKDYAYAASLYFHSAPNDAAPRRDLGPKLARWIGRHLQLAGISLLLSVLIGLPLGIVASRGGAPWSGDSRRGRDDSNHSVARPPRLARARAVSRHQRDDRDRGALSLRTPPDRAEHGHRITGHSSRAAGFRDRARPRTGSAPPQDLFAARLAHDSRRHQNQRGDQYRHSHFGGADRRRRPGRTDLERTESQ